MGSVMSSKDTNVESREAKCLLCKPRSMTDNDEFQGNTTKHRSDTRLQFESTKNIGIEVPMPFQFDTGIVIWKCSECALQDIKKFCSKSRNQKVWRPSQNPISSQSSTTQHFSKHDEWHQALIFDPSHSGLSKEFIKHLRQALRQCKITTEEINRLHDETTVCEKMFLICNKDDDGTATKAVTKYLDGISGHQYENMILVMHATEGESEDLSAKEDFFPTTSADKYKSIGMKICMSFQNTSDYKLENENSNALQKIKDYFAKLKRDTCQNKGPENVTCSNNSDKDQALSFDGSRSVLSKEFIKKLEEALVQYRIKAKEIDSTLTETPDRANICFICYKDNDDTDQQGFDNCTDKMPDDQYENKILVVMHTPEKGSGNLGAKDDSFLTTSADKYKSMGMKIDMDFQNTPHFEFETKNSDALQKMKDYFAKLKRDTCQNKGPENVTCSNNSDKDQDVPCIRVLPASSLVKICFQTFKNDLKKENVSLTELPLEHLQTLNDDKHFVLVYMQDDTTSINQKDLFKFIGKDKLKRMAFVNLSKESARQEICITDPNASKASTEFVEQLKNKMKENGISIETFDVRDVRSLKQDAILILVCNISSRIEADLNKCLSHIPSQQLEQIVVLVLHVGRKSPHASLEERISENVLSGMLAEVRGSVDMTFERNTEILTNDLNIDAYKKLTTLLQM